MPPSIASSSECTCYRSQLTTSTQSLAIGVCAVFGVIILILFAATIAVMHRTLVWLLPYACHNITIAYKLKVHNYKNPQQQVSGSIHHPIN